MEFHLLQMSIKAMCAAVRPTMTEYVKKYRGRINLHATVSYKTIAHTIIVEILAKQGNIFFHNLAHKIN